MSFIVKKYETNVVTGSSYQVWPTKAKYKTPKGAMTAIENDISKYGDTISKVFTYQDPKEGIKGEQTVYEAVTDTTKGIPYQVRYTIEEVA